MKIRIDKEGDLMIERAGTYNNVYCPFNRHGVQESNCGDWCALFGELEYTFDGKELEYNLELCHRIYYLEYGDFEDLRESIK